MLALNIEQHGIAKLYELITKTVTFGMYEHYPFGETLSIITIFVIKNFFIASTDSATFVIGMFSTGGQSNPSNILRSLLD